jgi:GTP cyclohydrolase I
LANTPQRVSRSYEEFFACYALEPEEVLQRTFEETERYDEMVLLKCVNFESHSEYDMVLIVRINKLARVVEAFGKRLQIQERRTKQIATTINQVIEPKGVGIVIEAQHQCMTTRRVKKPSVSMSTSCMLGRFKENPKTRAEFLRAISR